MPMPASMLPAPPCVFLENTPSENSEAAVRRIVIAVQDSIWAEALCRICRNVFPCAGCEEHCAARAALESLAAEPADLTITGLSFTDVDGLTVLDRLRSRSRRLLIVSPRKDDWAMMTLRTARFDGFFDPEADDLAMLERALRWIASDNQFVSVSMRERLLGRHLASPLTDKLTLAELKVFEIATNDGRTNAEVAQVLKISTRTVETHRRNIRRKLGVSSAIGLVREAFRLGIARTGLGDKRDERGKS